MSATFTRVSAPMGMIRMNDVTILALVFAVGLVAGAILATIDQSREPSEQLPRWADLFDWFHPTERSEMERRSIR